MSTPASFLSPALPFRPLADESVNRELEKTLSSLFARKFPDGQSESRAKSESPATMIFPENRESTQHALMRLLGVGKEGRLAQFACPPPEVQMPYLPAG